jgi:hypothetical protein
MLYKSGSQPQGFLGGGSDVGSREGFIENAIIMKNQHVYELFK